MTLSESGVIMLVCISMPVRIGDNEVWQEFERCKRLQIHTLDSRLILYDHREPVRSRLAV